MDLAQIVKRENLQNVEQIVDHFLLRLMSVQTTTEQRQALIDALKEELGTENLEEAQSYIEDPLRKLVKQIMSLPEYQLG